MTDQDESTHGPIDSVTGGQDSRGVDAGVCQRQCLGAGFVRQDDYLERAAKVMAGRLRISPHPEWKSDDLSDWAADPFTSRNWQFQHHALRWLSPVRHLASEGDQRAREFWLDTVHSWIEQNPPEAPASSFSWIDMADGLRAQELVFGWPLAEGEDQQRLLLGALDVHGQWLAAEEHQSEGNHALHQNLGLFVLASFLRRQDWQDLAVQRMGALFSEAFDDNGANNEGSTEYHRLNLAWWRAAWDRVALEGLEIPSNAQKTLARAATFLAHATRPDGHLVTIGDTHLKKIGTIGQPEVDYAATLGEEGTPPEAVTTVVPNGFVLGRSGWGEPGRSFEEQSFYSLRYGPRIRSHQHEDRGSLTFFTGGQDWLLDPGSYNYEQKDPFREYLRSRQAHNLVIVDDRAYNRSGHVRLERSEIDGHAHDYIVRDENYSGAILQRRMVYLPGLDLMVVLDHIEADKQVTARQLWHFDEDVKARLRDSSIELQAPGGRSFTLRWLGHGERPVAQYATEESAYGWVSRAWGRKHPGGVVEVTKRTRDGELAVVFGDSSQDPWTIVSSRSTPKSTWLRVLRFGRVWHVSISADRVEIEEDRVRTAQLSGEGDIPAVAAAREDGLTAQRLADIEQRVARLVAQVQQPPQATASASAERVDALETQLRAVDKELIEARKVHKAARTREKKRVATLLAALSPAVPPEAVLGGLSFRDVAPFIDDPLYLYELWKQRGDQVKLNLGARRELFRSLYQRGYYGLSLDVLRGIASATQQENDLRMVRIRASELALLRGQLKPECAYPEEEFSPVTGRVMHVVGKALPETQTGYTLRTHYLAQAQADKGYDVHVMRQAGAHADAHDETLVERDGVTYHLPEGPSRGSVEWGEWLQASVDALREIVREQRPSVLHCHSDYINQLIARPVADAFGLPVIYESRGFWEESWLSRVETAEGRPLDGDYERYGLPEAYTLRRERENQARADSDYVTTLAEVMKEHIVERGEDAERISVTPNGVRPADFPVVEVNQELKAELGIPSGSPVIGYITSVVEYEGIDTLISAFARIRRQGSDVWLLLVGDGPVRASLEQLAANLGVQDQCLFTGRIPHEQVLDYYSLIDLFVVPRKDRAVCRLVTPLKPFEAFSTGRTVIVSDVDALQEIARQSNAAAIFHAEDVESLATTLTDLLADPERRAELAAQGARWVRAERSWEAIADRYDEPYGTLGMRMFEPAATEMTDAVRQMCQSLRQELDVLSRDEALRFLHVHGKSGKADLVSAANGVMTDGWGGHGFSAVKMTEDFDWTAIADQDRTWQMHMHSWEFMVAALDAWEETGSGDYIEWAVSRALHWGRVFTSLDSESMAWYDMALSYRSVVLQSLTRAAAQTSSVSDTDFEALLILALRQRDAHWESWSFNARNNHGYYSAVSQVVLARALPGLPGMRALQHQGNVRLRIMTASQFNADGGHAEHSPDYHRMLLNSFEGAISLGAIDDPEVLDRVRKAADVLGWMILPTGRILQMGDSPERDMRGARSEISTTTDWVLTRGREGQVPDQDALLLPETGYAFVRPLASRDAEGLARAPYLAVCAGFHSRTHKHCDDQSLVWVERGQEILIDGGRYRYGELLPQDSELRSEGFYYADPIRQYMESCAAHSTLSIDGVLQDRRREPYGGGIKSLIHNQDGSYTITTEVPQNGWSCLRTITYAPGLRLQIRDIIDMEDEDEHTLHTWFLVAGSLSLDESAGDIVLSSPEWVEVLRVSRTTNALEHEHRMVLRDHREEPIRGVRSRQDRRLEPAWSVEHRQTFRGQLEATTVFEFQPPTTGELN